MTVFTMAFPAEGRRPAEAAGALVGVTPGDVPLNLPACVEGVLRVRPDPFFKVARDHG